ncbi:MAG: 4-(cytidine 5'-diphospho)-2-C-methyl-D-erythritol kinase [Nitrospinae bacterium]|nr:4-(cytidine 5'-diphospho)-2-C-methyl-D-erythritol kinase [Nitrospinota bacterium]
MLEKRKRKKVKSYSKINLGLKVTGKRDDGFHEIVTLFHAINLCDEITFEITEEEGISLDSDSTDIPLDESNLCWKAAKMFLKHFKIKVGVKIYLKKNIPVSAGLGGGSGNAAATLLCLAELLKIKKNKLYPLALKLGSDVPFFLSGYGTAVGNGRGELVTEVDEIHKYLFLLINPGIEISASWAYLHMDRFSEDDPEEMENDLESGVIIKYPIIKILKEELKRKGARESLMSGSGSTVFGIFRTEEALDKAEKYFKYRYKNFFIVKAKSYFPFKRPTVLLNP